MNEIPLLPGNVSLLEFSENFLHKNVPCLIDQSLTCSWKARINWQINGQPNFEYLKKEFGNVLVPVADCNDLCFSSHSKTTWNFNEYINYWQNKIATDNVHVHVTRDKYSDQPYKECSFETQQINVAVGKREKRLLYLKDWHFRKDFPSYKAYTVPNIFSCDWFNEMWEDNEVDKKVGGVVNEGKVGGVVNDDYRFVYMGPNGTWTPFHADVLRSYSWSVNICGHKEWIIYPPGQEEHLKDIHGNLPIDIKETLTDHIRYPNAYNACPPLCVIQEPGQAIFIPSGWYHQVKNIGDTISINHNWTNAFGIHYTLSYLKSELKLVEIEIDDCKSMEGWNEQCQLILKTETGMDFKDFYEFLHKIIRPTRLCKLSELKNQCPYMENITTIIDSLKRRQEECDIADYSGINFLLSILPNDITTIIQIPPVDHHTDTSAVSMIADSKQTSTQDHTDTTVSMMIDSNHATTVDYSVSSAVCDTFKVTNLEKYLLLLFELCTIDEILKRT